MLLQLCDLEKYIIKMFVIVSYCFLSLETIYLFFSKITINEILFLNLSSIKLKINSIILMN